MMGIGWCLLGISLATFWVPILPEMVELSLPHFPASQEKQVNATRSGLFNSSMGIGQLISSFYGSILYHWVGFRLTTGIAAIIGFAFFIIYFVFANVKQAFGRVEGATNMTDTSSQEQDMDDATVYI
jgi:predicted MFS family arabinose efflux permease